MSGDFPQIVPSNDRIIAGNDALPRDARQNMVLLRFRHPISMHLCWEFLRIRLGQARLVKGEPDNQAHVAPRTSALRTCPACKDPLTQVGSAQWVCTNNRGKACRIAGKIIDEAAPRGVINVFIPSDQLVDGNMAQCCVLVLDRRYPTEVLASTYRAAATLCDMMGWVLK